MVGGILREKKKDTQGLVLRASDVYNVVFWPDLDPLVLKHEEERWKLIAPGIDDAFFHGPRLPIDVVKNISDQLFIVQGTEIDCIRPSVDDWVHCIVYNCQIVVRVTVLEGEGVVFVVYAAYGDSLVELRVEEVIKHVDVDEIGVSSEVGEVWLTEIREWNEAWRLEVEWHCASIDDILPSHFFKVEWANIGLLTWIDVDIPVSAETKNAIKRLW